MVSVPKKQLIHSLCLFLTLLIFSFISIASAESGELKWENVTLNQPLSVDAGKELTLELVGNNTLNSYIYVPKGTTLNIVGNGSLTINSSRGFNGYSIGAADCGNIRIAITGTLTINPNTYGCAIGGDYFESITIDSGTIIAEGRTFATVIGGENAGRSGGVIQINGGSVKVTSSAVERPANGIYSGNNGTLVIRNGTVDVYIYMGGVGIGGGNKSSTLIYNGKVTSHGCGNGEAAIGGKEGSSVTIYNGTVRAICDTVLFSDGAAIGGGKNHKVTINGGNVTASAGYYAAAIGGNAGVGGGDITINGGTVTATGSTHDGAAIGGGQNGSGGNVIIRGGTVTAKFGTRYKDTCPDVIGRGNGGGTSGTLTIEPQTSPIEVIVGTTQNSSSPIAGSPFSRNTDIISLVKNNKYFHLAAPNYRIPDFDQYSYRAQKIMLAEDTGTVGTINAALAPDFSTSEFIELMKAYRKINHYSPSSLSLEQLKDNASASTPTRLFVDLLQDQAFFTNPAQAFLLFTESLDTLDKGPLNIANIHFSRRDVYKAIILNALEITTEDSFKDYSKVLDPFNDATDPIRELVERTDQFLQLEYKMKEEDLFTKDLDQDTETAIYKRINKLLGTSLNKEMNGSETGFNFANAFFKNVSEIKSAYTTLEDYFREVHTRYCMFCMSDSLKQVVRELYECCPEGYPILKLALQDCKDIIDASVEEFNQKVIFEPLATEGGSLLAKHVNSEIWKLVTKTLKKDPVTLSLTLVYKAERFIFEMLGVDDTVEQYLKMAQLLEVKDVAQVAAWKCMLQFTQKSSKENAAIMIDALNTLLALDRVDCEYAKKFCDVQNESLVGQIISLFGGHSIEDAKRMIETSKKKYRLEHFYSTWSWIELLNDDYPQSGLYEHFEHIMAIDWNKTFGTQYVFSCPVNIYVYDSDNRLVAKAENGVAYAEGDILVHISGDAKTLYFGNDEKYHIVIRGYDIGSMNVEIIQNNDAGEPARKVFFKDIPISNDTVLTTDTKTYNDQSEYQLSGTNPVYPIYDSLLSRKAYHAEVFNGYISKTIDSTFLFEIDAAENEPFEITAYVPEGSKFVGWSSTCGNGIFEDPTAFSTIVYMPNSDVVINAIIQNTGNQTNHSIIATSNEGGITGGSGIYGAKSYATVYVKPNDGYRFVGWYEDETAISTEEVYSFIVKKDSELHAMFESNSLAGSLIIQGQPVYGQTMSAVLSSESILGTLTYTWKRDGIAVGTGKTYTPTVQDIGKSLTCEVTSTVETGCISATTAVITKQAGPAAPVNLIGVAPTLFNGRNGKIVGTTAEMELSDAASFASTIACGNGETGSLEAGTYYVRYKETETTYAGECATVVVPEYIKKSPVIQYPEGNQTVNVEIGQTASMSVVAENGTDYQWFVDRNDGKGFVAIHGAENEGYTTTPTKKENEGYRYFCRVTNIDGFVDSPIFTLHVVQLDSLPETGDHSNWVYWMIMAVACTAAVFLLVHKQRAE